MYSWYYQAHATSHSSVGTIKHMLLHTPVWVLSSTCYFTLQCGYYQAHATSHSSVGTIKHMLLHTPVWVLSSTCYFTLQCGYYQAHATSHSSVGTIKHMLLHTPVWVLSSTCYVTLQCGYYQAHATSANIYFWDACSLLFNLGQCDLEINKNQTTLICVNGSNLRVRHLVETLTKVPTQ